MSNQNEPGPSTAGTGLALGRRQAVKGLTAFGGAVLGSTAIGGIGRARAQGAKTLRVWTTQGAPLQRDAYKFIIQAFEAENPNIKIALEFLSDNDAFRAFSTEASSSESTVLIPIGDWCTNGCLGRPAPLACPRR